MIECADDREVVVLPNVSLSGRLFLFVVSPRATFDGAKADPRSFRLLGSVLVGLCIV